MYKSRLMVMLVMISMLFASVGWVTAQDDTIADLASGNEDFSSLMLLLESTELTELLAGDEALTVFAPTNEAIEALPIAVRSYLFNNPDVLTRVLSYHVVAGEVLSSDLSEGMAVPTLEGTEATITLTPDARIDGVAITLPDVVASNGVIHVINQVLIPDFSFEPIDPRDYPDGNTVSMAHTEALTPVFETLFQSWEEAGGTAPITETLNSDDALESLCAGELPIVAVERPLSEEEQAECAVNAIALRIGADALAVSVGTGNDFVQDVTQDELTLIFGDAVNWSDIRAEWPAEAITRVDDPSALGDNPYAVSQYRFSDAPELATVLIDGIALNEQTVAQGTYPLTVSFYLYTSANALDGNPPAIALMNYFVTFANDAISEAGYFNASERDLNSAHLSLIATNLFDV